MKNKIGYRKIIYILLTALVLALSLTACGEDSSDDDKKDKGKKKQTVAEAKEEDDKEADEETEPVLGWLPEKTPESVWDSIEEATPMPTATPAVVDKYKDYFKKYGSIIKENVEIKVSGEYKGIEFNMKYAYNDNYLFMEIELEDSNYTLQMVGTVDKLCVCLESGERDRKYANIDINRIEELDSLFLVDEFLALAEGITNERFEESITDNGVRYDVISGSVKDYRIDSWHDVKSRIYSETQKPKWIIIYFENDEKIKVSFDYMSEDAMNREIEEKIGLYTNSDKKLVGLDKIQEMYDSYFDYKYVKTLFEDIVK